jgi:hypothetical protein
VIADQGFDNGWRYRNAREVPVFIVGDAHLGKVESAFVPEGEDCVFVGGRSLERQFDAFYLRGSNAWQQYSSFEKSLVVALMLLHELGHVRFGDGGSYGPPARLALDDIAKPSGTIANKEMRADRFASELIMQAWNSGEMKGPMLGNYGRAWIASNIYRVITIGSNTFDLHIDPHGVLDKLPKLDVFRAAGYSHLNTYLRLLIILHQLEPTDERLSMLRAIDAMFESIRAGR